MTAAEVVRAASDLIEAEGFWRAGEPRNGYCCHTAITSVDAPAEVKREALAIMYAFVADHGGWPGIGPWNDAHAKPFVVASMRKAARAIQRDIEGVALAAKRLPESKSESDT